MFRFLLCWPLLLLPFACAATSSLPPAPFDLAAVSPRYHGEFVELLGALEDQDNPRAERLLEHLVPSLQAELDQGDEALQAELGWQLRAAERFRRILDGRERLAALQFDLHVSDDHGGAGQRTLLLTIRSRWPAALELRPGPAMLEQHALLMGPGGVASEYARSRVLEGLRAVKLAPLASRTVDLGPYPTVHLGGALALRESFILRMGAGGVQEQGQVYPAQRWPDASGVRIGLAAFLPNGVLDPSELLEHVEDADFAMAALVERVVRIDPKRYHEAARGMAAPASRATPEMFERMEPLLRWLCFHDPKPSGLEAWREHLARLSEG